MNETYEDIQRELHKLEDQQDDLERFVRKVEQKEEELIFQEQRFLSENERRIQDWRHDNNAQKLLLEQQEIVQKLFYNRLDFMNGDLKEIKKAKEKISRQEDECYRRMQNLDLEGEETENGTNY